MSPPSRHIEAAARTYKQGLLVLLVYVLAGAVMGSRLLGDAVLWYVIGLGSLCLVTVGADPAIVLSSSIRHWGAKEPSNKDPTP